MLPTPKSTTFASELKSERKKAGFTQGDLSEKVGISKIMPGRYERGQSIPTMKTWQRLNQVLFGREATEEEMITVTTPLDSESLEPAPPTLDTVSVEEIIEELKRRGATQVQLRF